MPKLKDPEVVNLLKERFEGLRDDERLLELAALGFEQRLAQLYQDFQKGEISLEYLAEQLGLNIWEAESLLKKRELPNSNL